MDERKQVLNVNTASSDAVRNWRTTILVFAWIMLIGGIITIIAGDGSYEPEIIITGVMIVVSSIMMFLVAGFLRGFLAIVQNAEYEKAKTEKTYEIKRESGDTGSRNLYHWDPSSPNQLNNI